MPTPPPPAYGDLLTEAARIAATGPVLPAGYWAYRGAAAAVAALPPGARPAALWAALGRLAEDDPAAALHGLAQAIRAERDADIAAVEPRRWSGLGRTRRGSS